MPVQNERVRNLLNYQPIKDPAKIFQEIKNPMAIDDDEDDDGEGMQLDEDPQATAINTNEEE